MKTIRTLLLCALTALSLSLGVSATDSNAFFNEHAEECAPDGGSYVLNGDPGYVTVLEAPRGDPQSYLCNEQTLTVYGVWTDNTGGAWAQLRYTPTQRGSASDGVNGQKIGWARMTELYPVEGKRRFVNEHFSEFTSSMVRLTVTEDSFVGLWPYPGSGGQPQDLRWYLPDGEGTLDFSRCWVDSCSRRWGAVQLEEADGFVCLDEPDLAENLLPEITGELHCIPAALPETLPRVIVRETVEKPLWPWIALSGSVALLCVIWLLRQRHLNKTEE